MPLSPWMKQLISLPATFSRSANSFRIDLLMPVSEPNVGIIGTSVFSGDFCDTARMIELPIASVASAGNIALWTVSPCRCVPFSEPESSTRQPSGPGISLQ